MASRDEPRVPGGERREAVLPGDFSALGSSSAPGWLVDGDGRLLEGIGSNAEHDGMKIAGNGNTIHNSFANDNVGGGITMIGDGNTVDAVQASRNDAGYGINVVGKGNTIANSTARRQRGRRHPGGRNGQPDQRQQRLTATSSTVSVSPGAPPSAPTWLTVTSAAQPAPATGESALPLTGTGSGAVGSADIKGNITRGNASDGIQVTGSGHKLKNNSSGGSGSDGNHACQYRMASGNINMSGNTIGSVPIPGANGSSFPGCL